VFLRDWAKVFQADQLLVIKAENYYADKKGTLSEVFKYLEIGKKRPSEQKDSMTL
jgi:N-acetylgalactosamine 4-sulfate 6-O-sulfotransferase